MFVRELGGLFRVQRDERRHEWPAVAYGHGMRDQALPLQSTFDVARRDVLAASRDDQVFLAIGDAQVSVRIELTDIAGVQPAAVEGLGRGVRLLVVGVEHDPATNQDLAVVGDANLVAAQCLSHRADARVGGAVHRGQTRAFRLPVHLEHLEAEAREEAQHLGRDRCRTAGKDDRLVEPEMCAQLRQHQSVGEARAEAPSPRHLRARSGAQRPMREPAARRRQLVDSLAHLVRHLFPDPGHGEERGGSHRAQARAETRDVVDEVHRAAEDV